MASIFSSAFGNTLLSVWYHFAIMFEALFILTTIDSGTRVGRFLLQESIGRVWKRWGDTNWLPSALGSSALMVIGWGYFIWTGSINTIWPMFGIANQLLASVALAVGTTIIINSGKARYAWVTMLPLSFVAVTTLSAGVLSVRDNFWPLAVGPDPSRHFTGYLNSGLTVMMMVAVVVILANAALRCLRVLSGRVPIHVADVA
jgi:carbon starvation protein